MLLLLCENLFSTKRKKRKRRNFQAEVRREGKPRSYAVHNSGKKEMLEYTAAISFAVSFFFF